MRDTIDMAREAGVYKDCDWRYGMKAEGDSLKAFEALVRADEQEKYKWDIHSWGPTCKRYACVAMREAVEAEREACLSVIKPNATPMEIAAAIRARGNT
jgi:hypothetical protein